MASVYLQFWILVFLWASSILFAFVEKICKFKTHLAPKYQQLAFCCLLWTDLPPFCATPPTCGTTTKHEAPYLKSNICCWCPPHSCLTSGTHMAALKQTCPARFCHLAHPSQTSRSTVRPCRTPQRASIWTNLTPTTFMKSRGLSTRADVSPQTFFMEVWGITVCWSKFHLMLTSNETPILEDTKNRERIQSIKLGTLWHKMFAVN